MKAKPEVTDNEIQDFMNFEKLLFEKDKFLSRQKKYRSIRNISIAILSIGLIVYTVFFYGNFWKKPYRQGKTDTRVLDDSLKEHSNSLSATKVPNEAPRGRTEISGKEKMEIPTKRSRAEKTSVDVSTAQDVLLGDPVYIQAVPMNGYPELYKYFNNELKYPEEAIKDSIAGVVTVIFTINANGKGESIQFENSLGKPFDQEVKRLMENMPAWNPASYNGKPVASKLSLPLTFELKKLNVKE